jgi:hypothetical protein
VKTSMDLVKFAKRGAKTFLHLGAQVGEMCCSLA